MTSYYKKSFNNPENEVLRKFNFKLIFTHFPDITVWSNVGYVLIRFYNKKRMGEKLLIS
jgi:hypothetical protein